MAPDGARRPPGVRRAFVLVGPTASGKTDLAHALALRLRTWILSADSMLVYRGMDIGTAKPSRQQRAECRYEGLDLADPAEPFSVEQYLGAVRALPADVWVTPPVVVGGTGLYINALLYGLAAGPAPDPAYRDQLHALLAGEGVGGLQALARETAPGLLESLADPGNPRRLIRGLEKARAGEPATTVSWADRSARPGHGRAVGIRFEREVLRSRIAERLRRMYEQGLLEEASALQHRPGGLSDTARQAIGYREAFAVLDGTLDRGAAMDRTVTRTAQLAKRQMTWFRRQVPVVWVNGASPPEGGLPDTVYQHWTNDHGFLDLHLGA